MSTFLGSTNTSAKLTTASTALTAIACAALSTNACAICVGSAIGIAVIGSVLFGTLHITSKDPVQIQQAFVDSAAHAMAVSAVLSVVSFALVFVLPRKVDAHGGPPADRDENVIPA